MGLRQQRPLAKNDGPGHQRGEQQQAHDGLHHRARIDNQSYDRKFIVHHSPSEESGLRMKSGKARGRNDLASTQTTRTSPSASSVSAVPFATREISWRKRMEARPSGTGTQLTASSSSSRAGLRYFTLASATANTNPYCSAISCWEWPRLRNHSVRARSMNLR